MESISNKINGALSYVNDLDSKINLLTLTIRDKEMEKQYLAVRERYYWETIFVIDILREITLYLTYLGGFFENRTLLPSYAFRITYYITIISLYKLSQKRPRVKDFISIIIITQSCLVQFNNPTIGILMRDAQGLEDVDMSYFEQYSYMQFTVIKPVVSILFLLKACFMYSTKFWIAGYVVIPISMFFYYLTSFQHEMFKELKEVPNFNFILFPNYCLIAQVVFTFCYITELQQINIFFRLS